MDTKKINLEQVIADLKKDFLQYFNQLVENPTIPAANKKILATEMLEVFFENLASVEKYFRQGIEEVDKNKETENLDNILNQI